jgi:hypothetical protein
MLDGNFEHETRRKEGGFRFLWNLVGLVFKVVGFGNCGIEKFRGN